MINLLATRTDLQNKFLINYFKNTKINVVNFPFFKIEPILKNESIQYILHWCMRLNILSKLIRILKTVLQASRHN